MRLQWELNVIVFLIVIRLTSRCGDGVKVQVAVDKLSGEKNSSKAKRTNALETAR